MKATLFAIGFADEEYGCEIEDMVNFTTLDLPRIPNKGEMMQLWIDDAWVEARVADVCTNFKERGNPHIKESAWGVDFTISLDRCEIVEWYKK